MVAATYSHRENSATIGLEVFHFCVRDGNRWNNLSIAATIMFNLEGPKLYLLFLQLK